MTDNERIQSMKERYAGADRDAYVEGQDIWFLVGLLEKRDKTIAKSNDRIYRLEAELEARRATDGLSVIEQQNALMLSALETIKTYERCGELHGQTCASIARDAIAQVKESNNELLRCVESKP